MTNKTQKTTSELEAHFAEMDKRIHQAEDDLGYIREFATRITTINENIGQLSDYYQSDWMNDVDSYIEKNGEKIFLTTNQDSIWNVTQDYYLEKIQILKSLVNSL